MADQQTAPVMLDDELRANMTHEEQIQHLEALVRRVRDQWQAEHREYLQRSNNQEREITRLCDELQASRDEAAHAWSLVPDARQREEIEKRTSWSTHVDPAAGGTAIVAECRFRNSHFHVTDLISKEGLEKGEDAIEFQINDATQRLRRGIMAGACKELGIRTEEQEQQPQGEAAEVEPDAFAVIDHKGEIQYSVSMDKEAPSESLDWGRDMCHQHINDCAGSGVEGSGRWVVRPVFVGRPPAPATAVLEEARNIAVNAPVFAGDTISHGTADQCEALGWAKRDTEANWVPTERNPFYGLSIAPAAVPEALPAGWVCHNQVIMPSAKAGQMLIGYRVTMPKNGEGDVGRVLRSLAAPAPAEPFTEHSRPEDDARAGMTPANFAELYSQNPTPQPCPRHEKGDSNQ